MLSEERERRMEVRRRRRRRHRRRDRWREMWTRRCTPIFLTRPPRMCLLPNPSFSLPSFHDHATLTPAHHHTLTHLLGRWRVSSRGIRPSSARATRPSWSCARWRPGPVCLARCDEGSRYHRLVRRMHLREDGGGVWGRLGWAPQQSYSSLAF